MEHCFSLQKKEAEQLAADLQQQQVQQQISAAVAIAADAEWPLTREHVTKVVTYVAKLPVEQKLFSYTYMFGGFGGIAIAKTLPIRDLELLDVAVAACRTLPNLVMGHCVGQLMSGDARISYVMSVPAKNRIAANECCISVLNYNDEPCYLNTHAAGEQMVHRIYRPINNSDVPNVSFFLRPLPHPSRDAERTDMLLVISTRQIEAGELLIANHPPDGFQVPLHVRDRPKGRAVRPRKGSQSSAK